MGCKWCTSGLGRTCQGPNGIDDLECGCDCDCHKCPDCFSPFCENIGGDEPCECDDDLNDAFDSFDANDGTEGGA